MNDARRARIALLALGAILVITTSWWAMALWPVAASAPEWFLRTREVCFGATATGLPNAGGWLLLVGQPLGMLIVLAAVWPAELRAGLVAFTARWTGQVAAGVTAAALTAGLIGVGVRVISADDEPFATRPDGDLAAHLTRVNDRPPAMELIDQQGRTVTLDQFRGRPVVVTFAYAHCETVCPMVVNDVLAAERRLTDRRPAVLIITLDPWRDTPSRLGAMAAAWKIDSDARVLSGAPDAVDRVVNAWRVPRVRNERTGDVSHPSLVYVIAPDGRIAYVLPGGANAIVAAVREL